MIFVIELIASIGSTQATSIYEIPLSEEYVLRSWEVNDGLPSNTVNGVVETSEGYLWVATPNGLARFDGATFALFNKKNTPVLTSSRFDAVFASRENDLWAGFGRGGVARLRGGNFEVILPERQDAEPRTSVTSFVQDPMGAVWFSQTPANRVDRWRDGSLTAFTDQLEFKAAFELRLQGSIAGQVWFSNNLRCGTLEGEKVRTVDPEGGQAIWLTPSRNGGMWAVRGQQLLRYHDDGSKEVVADLPWSEGASIVLALYEDKVGNLWIGTRIAGLIRFRDRQFVRVPTSHSAVRTIAEDHEGNLWVGTGGGGLDRLRQTCFRLHQTTHGLLRNDIVSLDEDGEGRLWIAEIDGSVVRSVDSGNRRFVAAPKGVLSGVLAVQATKGDLWFATYGDLFRWTGNDFKREKFETPSTGLLMDREGILWVATINAGLCRWRDGKIEHIPEKKGLVRPRALAEDGEGCLWVGTERGRIFRREKDQFVEILLPESRNGHQVRFIVPDEKDAVWIGTYEGGLYRWRAGKVTQLPHGTDLPDEDLRALTIDSSGDFWLATGRGLFRVKREQLETAMGGRAAHLRVIRYGHNDGLPSMEFSFGFRHGNTQTRDGHLWFATYSGALEVDPLQSAKPVESKPLLIEEVKIGGVSVMRSNNKKLVIPPRPSSLQIRYASPQFTAPEEIRFRYRLIQSGEEEWINAGSERTATFTHLPAADYRFEVAATDLAGTWLPTVSLEVTIQPAWWETIWFRFAAGLTCALGLALLVRYVVNRRMQTRMRRLEQENAVERERTRIARDMHDQVGANLTQIALFAGLAESESEKESPGAAHAARAAASAHQAINALDEIVWAVNPRHDNLPSLLDYLGQRTVDYLHGIGIRCILDLPHNPPPLPLPADYRHHFFLIVNEALNNAVRHAAPHEIRMKIQIYDSALTVEIADDGQGFSEDKIQSGSNGLINMRERAAALNGTCQIESQPGHGTRLRFDLPLPSKKPRR
ncbi:MAG: two-component regulator propeller domain-containing protein [Chthoniobacterales bacterium]